MLHDIGGILAACEIFVCHSHLVTNSDKQQRNVKDRKEGAIP